MSEPRKAVIKNVDMSEDMQQDAVDCATVALEKFNIEKDVAAYIKKVRCCLPVNKSPFFFPPQRVANQTFGLARLPSRCRSLTKSTTPPGTASWAATLAPT